MVLFFDEMRGGEIFVKKLPSFTVLELAKAISLNNKFKIIGIRPGEKMHEQMISSDDSMYTYDFKDHFKILPTINNNKEFYKIKKITIMFRRIFLTYLIIIQNG